MASQLPTPKNQCNTPCTSKRLQKRSKMISPKERPEFTQSTRTGQELRDKLEIWRNVATSKYLVPGNLSPD